MREKKIKARKLYFATLLILLVQNNLLIQNGRGFSENAQTRGVSIPGGSKCIEVLYCCTAHGLNLRGF